MSIFPQATHAYIGRNADGKVRAIVMDDPGYESDTAKIVFEWICMGRTVERHPRDIAVKLMRT